MAANAGFAIPLCLPNNCQWNEHTSEFSRNSEERNSLYVVEKALDQLKKVKGMSASDKIKGLQKKLNYHRLKVNGTSWVNHSVSWLLRPSLLDIGSRACSIVCIVLNRLF